MAKIFQYVLVLSGLLLLLAVAGFPTATNWLLSSFGLTGSSTGIQVSGIIACAAIVAIAALLTVSAATSGQIQIGTFSMNVTESKIVATFANTLMIWGLVDMGSIIKIATDTGQTWISVLTGLIFGPLMIAYAIGIIQFWRGNDI